MGKLLSKEEFVAQAIIVFGDRYDYTNSNYINRRSNIVIKCVLHEEFSIIASQHLAGTGCPVCKKIKASRPRPDLRSSTEDFTKKAKVIHGDKYNYSKTIYFKAVHKVIITCDIEGHGDFLQTPNSHLNGAGCYYCGRKVVEAACRNDTDDFIVLAKKVHGDRYDYSKAIYINFISRVEIICREHGSFWPKARKHLNGHHCKKCRNQEAMLTPAEIIRDFRVVHGDHYNYDKVEYNGIFTPIIITCPEHGDFQQQPTHHKLGRGCKKCKNNNISKLETLWLNKVGVPDTPEHRNIYMNIGGTRYCVDGYIQEANTIYEFNGDFYHGNPDVYGAEEHNTLLKETYGALYKKTLLKQNKILNAGYKLVVMWENDFLKEVDNDLYCG